MKVYYFILFTLGLAKAFWVSVIPFFFLGYMEKVYPETIGMKPG